jgi:tetratricopeptide (TPR) repeat protein
MRCSRFLGLCLLSCLLFLFCSNVSAQGGPRPTPTPVLPTYPNFTAAMAAADGFLTTNNPDKAKLSFDAAMLLAADDEQRADVHFGRAKVHLSKKSKVRLGTGEYVDRPDYYTAISEYEKAAALKAISPGKRRKAYDTIIEVASVEKNHWRISLTYDAIFKAFPQMPVAEKTALMFKQAEAYPLTDRNNASYAFRIYSAITTLAGVSDVDKAKALIQMGELEDRFGNKQGAFQHFSSVTLTAGATVEQKATATMFAGKMLWELGQADQGQAMIAKTMEMKDAPAAVKADAHTLLAQSYGLQKKPDLEIAEYAKIPSIKGVSDEDKAKAWYAIGDLHMKADRYPAARSEFKKIFQLKQVPNSYLAVAYSHTGKAFEKENNPKEARAAWNKMFALAESPQYKSEALGAIADSFRAEKKFAEAAAALVQRAAIDKAPEIERFDALADLGDVYLEQKDGPKAAAAYAQAVAVKGDIKQEPRMRAFLGAVEAQKLVRDAAATAAAYGELAEFLQRSSLLPADLRNARLKDLWDLAESWGRDDSTALIGIAIYNGILKGNAGIVISITNRANLGLGDILLRQKKFPDAKVHLQKVTVGQFTNSEELKKQVAEATQKMAQIP